MSCVWEKKNLLKKVEGVASGQAVTLGLSAAFTAFNKTSDLWEFLDASQIKTESLQKRVRTYFLFFFCKTLGITNSELGGRAVFGDKSQNCEDWDKLEPNPTRHEMKLKTVHSCTENKIHLESRFRNQKCWLPFFFLLDIKEACC